MPLDATSNTNETATEHWSHHEHISINETQPRADQTHRFLAGPDHEFDDSRCLFCNTLSSSLEANVIHMSTSHGCHIDAAQLLVDPVSFLAYLHPVISGYRECLYCGTQRATHQAVQQHMTAKGHCMPDFTDRDLELRDFYE